MKSRKIDELAADIDDAADTVDKLQADAEVEPGTDTDKLNDLNETLEHASETIDDIVGDSDDPNDDDDEIDTQHKKRDVVIGDDPVEGADD